MSEEDVDIGRSRALGRVVDQFAAMVRQVGRARGLDPADLDLLIQDVRVRLWKTGASTENLEGLGSSYVYKVAMSAAIDLLRRERSRREDTIDEVSDMSSSALRVEPVDHAERDDLARRMRHALAAMARNRRVVVQLHLEGYERGEIASLTSWSDAKVRNLLYRGLEDLRSLLDDTRAP